MADELATSPSADVEAALRRLSRHYIPARHPDAHPSGPPAACYGAEDVRQALADLDVIVEFVASLWSQLDARGETTAE